MYITQHNRQTIFNCNWLTITSFSLSYRISFSRAVFVCSRCAWSVHRQETWVQDYTHFQYYMHKCVVLFNNITQNGIWWTRTIDFGEMLLVLTDYVMVCVLASSFSGQSIIIWYTFDCLCCASVGLIIGWRGLLILSGHMSVLSDPFLSRSIYYILCYYNDNSRFDLFSF